MDWYYVEAVSQKRRNANDWKMTEKWNALPLIISPEKYRQNSLWFSLRFNEISNCFDDNFFFFDIDKISCINHANWVDDAISHLDFYVFFGVKRTKTTFANEKSICAPWIEIHQSLKIHIRSKYNEWFCSGYYWKETEHYHSLCTASSKLEFSKWMSAHN